jgi:hypothetical protein
MSEPSALSNEPVTMPSGASALAMASASALRAGPSLLSTFQILSAPKSLSIRA